MREFGLDVVDDSDLEDIRAELLEAIDQPDPYDTNQTRKDRE